MAFQSINLGSDLTGTGTEWTGSVLIDSALISGGGTAYLRRIDFTGAASIRIELSSTAAGTSSDAGPEFTATVEGYASAFTFIDSNDDEIVIPGPDHSTNQFRDPSEPYFWTAPSGTDWSTLANGNITLEISDGVSDLMPTLQSIDDIELEHGGTLNTTLPAATSGDTPITYAVTGLASWMDFDPSTRVLSGTAPNQMGSTEITYTATDSDGDTATETFDVDVLFGYGDFDVPAGRKIHLLMVMEGETTSNPWEYKESAPPAAAGSIIDSGNSLFDDSLTDNIRLTWVRFDSQQRIVLSRRDGGGDGEMSDVLDESDGELRNGTWHIQHSGSNSVAILSASNPREIEGVGDHWVRYNPASSDKTIIDDISGGERVLIAFTLPAPVAGDLFAVNSTNRQLYRIDPDDPDSTSSPYGFVGTLDSGISSPAAGAIYNGDLWVISGGSPQSLWRVNLTDPGSTTSPYGKVGDLASGIGTISGATIIDGDLLVSDVSNRRIWRINLSDPDDTSGNYGNAGTLFDTGSFVAGLAHIGGDLLGADITGDELFRINPVNPGSSTSPHGVVGSFYSDIGNPSGMTERGTDLLIIDVDDDVLYLVDSTDPDNTSGDYGSLGSLPSDLTDARILSRFDNAPSVPGNLTLVETHNFIDASWDESDGFPSSYIVRLRQTSTTLWTTATVHDTSHRFTGLSDNTEYEVQVQAESQHGESDFTDSVTVTTTEAMSLSDLDLSDYDIDADALLVAGLQNESTGQIWGRSPRPVLGSLEDGHFDIGHGQDDITELRIFGSGARFSIFDSSGGFNIHHYFRDGGDGRHLIVLWLLGPGETPITFTVADTYNTGGNGFARFDVPAAHQDAIGGIREGRQFIFALAGPATDISASSDLPVPTGTATLEGVDPDPVDISASSDLPVLTAEATLQTADVSDLDISAAASLPVLTAEATLESFSDESYADVTAAASLPVLTAEATLEGVPIADITAAASLPVLTGSATLRATFIDPEPGKPAEPNVISVSHSAQLVFFAPAETGADPTSYQLRYRTEDGAWVRIFNVADSPHAQLMLESGKTYEWQVRAFNNVTPGEWSESSFGFIPVKADVTEFSNLLISQYSRSTRFQELIAETLRITQEQLIDPLYILEHEGVIDVADGVWLDYIGSRLGMIRPNRLRSGVKFFAFDGGTNRATFGEAGFFSSAARLESLTPIDDTWFRSLLKGRAIGIRRGVTIPDIEAVCAAVFTGGAYVVEGTRSITVYVTESRDGFLQIAKDVNIIPKPAGIGLTISET